MVRRIPAAGLTARQTQIAVGLARDQTLTQVASTLHLSRETVKSHVRQMHEISGTHTLHGLVVWLLRSSACRDCPQTTGTGQRRSSSTAVA